MGVKSRCKNGCKKFGVIRFFVILRQNFVYKIYQNQKKNSKRVGLSERRKRN